MSINEELYAFWTKLIEDQEIAYRNHEAIAFYYGLRYMAKPTLNETAIYIEKNFNQSLTRERIRQIRTYFRNVIHSSDLPSIHNIFQILHKDRIWLINDFESRITDKGLISNIFSVRGILRLIDDLNIDHRYTVYDAELRKLTNQPKTLEAWIIHRDILSDVKKIYNYVAKMPGQLGIANLKLPKNLRSKVIDCSGIETLIENNPNSWTKRDGNNFWFLFENKDNTLLNYNKKVFSIFETCEIERLAATYRNALDSRTPSNGEYPPVEIIAEYLKECRELNLTGKYVYYNGKTRNLTTSEFYLIEYLSLNDNAIWSDILDHLLSKGIRRPTINKLVFYSPLVHKTVLSPMYTYNLVGQLKYNWSKGLDIGILQNRYLSFRKRLSKFQNTDEIDEVKIRKEQSVLRDWLFDDKKFEICGICGGRYAVRALVAAHKKKRSICTHDERIDPYIVMPMCLFGCDFLYEQGYIFIENGTVTTGLPIQHDGPEKKRVAEVVGRKLDERWLAGSETYFEK